jgi:hypothetical protein
VKVRKDDLPKFTGIVFSFGKDAHPDWGYEEWLKEWEEVVVDTETFVEVEDCQANYGFWDQTQDAAKAGCVFYGSHGAGGEYGCGGFVGVGEKFYGIDQSHYGNPTVCVEDDGTVSETALENVREYLKAKKVVRTEFGEENNDDQ